MDMSVDVRMPAGPKVMLLEDDNGVRRSLQMLLQGRGFAVKAYASASALLSDPQLAGIDCLVADYRLGASDGVAVLEALRSGGWNGPAILMTAFGTEELRARAISAGYSEIFEKPLKDHVLVAALQRLTSSDGASIGLLPAPGTLRSK